MADQYDHELSGAQNEEDSRPVWRVVVDPDKCLASGMCVSIAPDHFRLADNLSQPIRSPVEADDRIEDAADLCPVSAILIRPVENDSPPE